MSKDLRLASDIGEALDDINTRGICRVELNLLSSVIEFLGDKATSNDELPELCIRQEPGQLDDGGIVFELSQPEMLRYMARHQA